MYTHIHHTCNKIVFVKMDAPTFRYVGTLRTYYYVPLTYIFSIHYAIISVVLCGCVTIYKCDIKYIAHSNWHQFSIASSV